MMKSMTAYARAETSSESTTVAVEVRAYNSRFLDTVLRIPPPYNTLEDRIKALVTDYVNRGRIDLKLQIADTTDTAAVFQVNKSRAGAYHRALVELKDFLGLDGPIRLEQVAGVGDIIQPVQADVDIDRIWLPVEECLRQALVSLDAMRSKEGDFIAADMHRRLNAVSECLQKIAAESTDLLEHYRDRLKERVSALTAGVVEVDPQRLLQEAAIIADRSDVTEEIVRAQSHIRQFRTIMQSDEPAGRKLGFLLQELHREFNTIGAKTEKSTVSHLVVEVKSELEKMREQLQNVE
jgi:uncharacterized protein (TIGR00255 family)